MGAFRARLARALWRAYLGALKIDVLRRLWCRLRWAWMRHRMRMLETPGSGVSAEVIPYNLGAFRETHSVFGMGRRMGLLLYPAAALLREAPQARVLVVGPRTEDDIFWAWSLGLTDARGLDLFSYSPWIDVGDMHATAYPDASFDAVLLGWVLAYSSAPATALAECRRILKPGGLLGIGMESIAAAAFASVRESRPNPVNSVADLDAILGLPKVFVHDPALPRNYELAVLYRQGAAPAPA
jgi:SAM-dependent methyltransferase